MARIIEFFDGATSALTPVIGNIEAADLVDFANDAAYEAANVGAPFAGNIYFNTTDATVRYYDGATWIEVGRQIDIQANTDDIADIRTTTGTADGETNMGTYTGALINDNESTKQNIQQVETAVEANTQETADIRTTSGTGNGDTDMGAYTGAILTDNTNQRALNQEISNAIEAVPSGLLFKGNWDADTNTPTLSNSGGGGISGDYYNVSVAGSTSIDGITDWGIGDWIVNVGSKWDKIDNSENVTSVNTKTGAVVIDPDDLDDSGTTNKFNVNHTDEVTGDGALTLQGNAITNKAEIAPVSGDFFLFSDTSNSGILKKVDFDDMPGGGSSDWDDVVSKSATFTAVVGELYLVSPAASMTVNLPTAVGVKGKRIGIKKLTDDIRTLTIDPDSAELIDDVSTKAIVILNQSFVLVSDNVQWRIVEAYNGEPGTQTRFLAGDKTTTQTLTDLTFSNLVIGQWYRIDAKFQLNRTANGTATVKAVHNATTLDLAITSGVTSGPLVRDSININFKAAATTLTFLYTIGGTSTVFGNSTIDETFVRLTELSPLTETSKF